MSDEKHDKLLEAHKQLRDYAYELCESIAELDGQEEADEAKFQVDKLFDGPLDTPTLRTFGSLGVRDRFIFVRDGNIAPAVIFTKLHNGSNLKNAREAKVGTTVKVPVDAEVIWVL